MGPEEGAVSEVATGAAAPVTAAHSGALTAPLESVAVTQIVWLPGDRFDTVAVAVSETPSKAPSPAVMGTPAAPSML